MKVPKHDGTDTGDTYSSAPIQDRRRDASKDRPNTDYKSKYPNSKRVKTEDAMAQTQAHRKNRVSMLCV